MTRIIVGTRHIANIILCSAGPILFRFGKRIGEKKQTEGGNHDCFPLWNPPVRRYSFAARSLCLYCRHPACQHHSGFITKDVGQNVNGICLQRLVENRASLLSPTLALFSVHILFVRTKKIWSYVEFIMRKIRQPP